MSMKMSARVSDSVLVPPKTDNSKYNKANLLSPFVQSTISNAAAKEEKEVHRL